MFIKKRALSNLAEGESAFIVDLRDGKLTEYLLERGFIPGSRIYMKENKADKNSVVVKIGGRTIHIFRQSAETIITSQIAFDFCLN